MNAWLTPDAIPADTACVRLLVPNDVSLIAAVFGALLTLTEAENWEQYGTQTPEDTAQAMLNMYEAAAADAADCGASVNGVEFWHFRTTVDFGNPLSTSFAATIYHGFVSFQSPAAITDQWRTDSFHLSAGDYIFYFEEQVFTACGIIKFELRRVVDNAVYGEYEEDQFGAAAAPRLNAGWFPGVPEDDYYLHGAITGKRVASTGYQCRLSHMQLVRIL